MERYISDVRIAYAEMEAVNSAMSAVTKGAVKAALSILEAERDDGRGLVRH